MINLELIKVSSLLLVQAMNGQYLCNRQITVSYAYKKDTKGERHGTPAGDLFCLLSLCTFSNKRIHTYTPIKERRSCNGVFVYFF